MHSRTAADWIATGHLCWRCLGQWLCSAREAKLLGIIVSEITIAPDVHLQTEMPLFVWIGKIKTIFNFLFLFYCVEVHMNCGQTISWLTGEAQMKRSLCTRQSVSRCVSHSQQPPLLPFNLFLCSWHFLSASCRIFTVGGQGVSLSRPFFHVIIWRKAHQLGPTWPICFVCNGRHSTIKKNVDFRFQQFGLSVLTSTSDWSSEPGSRVMPLLCVTIIA